MGVAAEREGRGRVGEGGRAGFIGRGSMHSEEGGGMCTCAAGCTERGGAEQRGMIYRRIRLLWRIALKATVIACNPWGLYSDVLCEGFLNTDRHWKRIPSHLTAKHMWNDSGDFKFDYILAFKQDGKQEDLRRYKEFNLCLRSPAHRICPSQDTPKTPRHPVGVPC